MLQEHQYGASVPGRADLLIHMRQVLEQTLQDDVANGVWTMLGIDVVNAFPSFPGGAIEQAMDKHVPELVGWTRWCHQSAEPIELPCGVTHRAQRRAEQGDPHGIA